MARADRRGFTLIETLVALTLGAALVLVAHAAFAAAGDYAVALEESRASQDSLADARRTLGAAFSSLEIGTPGATDFEGAPARVAFSARLRAGDEPLGERVVVVITADNGSLIMRIGEQPRRLRSARDAVFQYLLEPGADAPWLAEWSSSTRAPLAVRLLLSGASASADTLLFIIGPRG